MKQQKIVDELIASGIFGEHLVLTPLRGGTVNFSYQLSTAENRYFLKTFELNHIAPTDRQALFYQQRQLATLGKATQPLYLSVAHDFQVESWVEHVSVAAAILPIEQKIERLAKELVEIHHLPSCAMSLDLPKDWLLYLDAAVKPDFCYWRSRIEACKPAWVDTHKTDQVLCHNDLAMAHVTIDDHSVVFDWEYSALGNRYFDVVCCALINRFSAPQSQLLQRLYAQYSGISLDQVNAQCQQQYPIAQLTHDLWYLAAKNVDTSAI